MAAPGLRARHGRHQQPSSQTYSGGAQRRRATPRSRTRGVGPGANGARCTDTQSRTVTAPPPANLGGVLLVATSRRDCRADPSYYGANTPVLDGSLGITHDRACICRSTVNGTIGGVELQLQHIAERLHVPGSPEQLRSVRPVANKRDHVHT